MDLVLHILQIAQLWVELYHREIRIHYPIAAK